MTIRLEYPQGATPLDPDWALTKKKAILSDNFLRELHKRMFGDVWRWAGQYRTSGKNTGSVTALTLGMSLLPDFIIGSS